MVMNNDSAFYKGEFLKQIETLKEDLEDDYDVKTYDFGERVTVGSKTDFIDQTTDFSALFKDLNTRYYNKNVGALIIASDGIYNTGSDPLYGMRNSKFPVYTILAGDTVSRKDIRIQKIAHNKTAFKGNRFPVEITLQAVEASGDNTVVKILKEDNTTVFTQNVSISSSNQVINIPALLEATETGLLKLTVTVDPVEGEMNEVNNKREIFIEVKENKLQVAIVSDLPHPDVAALQRVVVNSNNFEMKEYLSNEFSSQKPESFDLIILNQLPSTRNPFNQTLQNIIKSKTPVLFMLGSESNIPAFNSLNTGITITNFKGSFNEALPSLNPSFSLFLITESQKQFFEIMPPLISPFGSYGIANSVKTLAYQQVGSTRTEMPLIAFNETADNRTGVILGEGIWKWRVYDFIRNSTHSNFDEIFGKMFQYLTAQTDKSRFRIDWKNIYAENEDIEFNALLFNETYQPVTEPEVTLEITDENNRKFDFAFTAGNESYSLKVGTFEPGRYSFTAKANMPGEVLTKSGSFVVTDIDLENTNLTANHTLLKQLASESGGNYYYPSAMAKLAADIHKSENVKSISYTHKQYMDIIDYFPFMLLLFLLLGTEWFLRKYLGSY